MRLMADTSGRFHVSCFQYTSAHDARGLLGRSTDPKVSTRLDFGPGPALARKTSPKYYELVKADWRPSTLPKEVQSLYIYLKLARAIQDTPFNGDWSYQQALQPLQNLAGAIAVIFPRDRLVWWESAFEHLDSYKYWEPEGIALTRVWWTYQEVRRYLQMGESSVDVELRRVWEALRDLEHQLCLLLNEDEASDIQTSLQSHDQHSDQECENHPEDPISEYVHDTLCQLNVMEGHRIRSIGLAMSLFETGLYRQF